MNYKKGFLHKDCKKYDIWQMKSGVFICNGCGYLGINANDIDVNYTSEGKELDSNTVKLTYRFYKGSDSLAKHLTKGLSHSNTVIRETVEEAIEDAKATLEANRTQEVAFIVEIIKVVKRDRPPFTIKDVV